jgi:hypothetical protein
MRLSPEGSSPVKIFNEMFVPAGTSTSTASIGTTKRAGPSTSTGSGSSAGEKSISEKLSKLRQARKHRRAKDQGMFLSFIIFAAFTNLQVQFLMSVKSFFVNDPPLPQ